MVFLLETNMREKIYKVIAKSLNIDPSSLQEDLGPGDITEWDSLNHLRLMVSLQKNFKIKFELYEITNINSLQKWSRLIKKKLKIK